jgi:hypothetical protein
MLRQLPDTACQSRAVHPGHSHIEQESVINAIAGRVQSSAWVGFKIHAVSVCTQQLLQDDCRILYIVRT